MQIIQNVSAQFAPIAPRGDDQLRVGQLNAHNFFDTKDDASTQDPISTRADYQLHLAKLAVAISDAMGAPDVVTMQEVENAKVLQDLVARPEMARLGYRQLLKEGTDPRGIDNAILYRDTVMLKEVLQLDPLSVNDAGRGAHLFTRPPLMARFAINGRDGTRGIKEVTVIAAHFTSKLGQEDAARKRMAQAQVVANFAQGLSSLDPRAAVLVAGDLNMERDEPEFAPLRSSRHGASLISLAQQVPSRTRFSWRDGRKHLLLDHMLATASLATRVVDVQIPHISTQMEKGSAIDPVRAEGVSDHDPMVATINL